MKAYHNTAVLKFDDDTTGNAASGAPVTVRINSTQALAAIFDVDDVGIGNPLTTDSNGNYAFKVADGIYDIIVSEGTVNEVKLEKVEISEFLTTISVKPFDTLALAISSSSPSLIFEGSQLNLAGRVSIGDRRGGMWDVFTGLTANGRDIFDSSVIGFQIKERPTLEITYYDKISEMVEFETTAYINKKIYVRQVSTYYNMQSTGTVYDVAVGALFAVAVNVELSVNELPANKMLNDFNRGMASKGNTTLSFIGDSILNGAGALDWDTESAVLTERSIQNAIGKSSGYGVTTYMSGLVDKLNSGFTGNGTFVSDGGGPVEQAYRLVNTQFMQIVSKNFNQVRVYYTGSLTTPSATSTLELEIDGVSIETVTLTGTSNMDTVKFATVGVYIQRTSTVKLISGGTSTIMITGVELIRESGGSNAPVIFTHAYPAEGIQYFAQQVAVDDIAEMANIGPYSSGSGSSNQCFLLSIGTNNIYNPNEELSPTDMITQYQLFVDRIELQCSNASWAVVITPQANENIQPPILAFTYWQYQEALIDWCELNDYPMIRNDLLYNSKRGFMADELHPDDTGHAAIANLWCKYFNVAMNPYKYLDQMETTNDLTIRSGITYNDTWAATAGATPTFYLLDNVVTLSGRFSRNGSATATVGTLSNTSQFPATVKRLHTYDEAGTHVVVTITTAGQVSVDSITGLHYDLDGLNYVLNTNFIP